MLAPRNGLLQKVCFFNDKLLTNTDSVSQDSVSQPLDPWETLSSGWTGLGL